MTKDNILKVASQEFSAYGFDAVSMNILVKKLDINKATIYYHFKDKKALYQAVLAEAIGELTKNYEIAFEDNESKGGEELLRAYIESISISLKRNSSIVPLALREMANFGGNFDEKLIPFIDKEVEYIRLITEKLDLKDEYAEVDPYIYFSLIKGTIHEFYVAQITKLGFGTKDELKGDKEKSLDYISDFLTKFILDAICKKRS